MPKIILTNHAKSRLLERGIDFSNVKKIIKSALKTKVNSFATIKTSGATHTGEILEVVFVKEENKIIIKTAYYL